jgi:NitT/TauT family transport system substrate-binding protein
MIWEPNVYKIKTNLEGNTLTWPGQSGQSSYWLLLSKEDFTTKNPEIVKRTLKALLQAEEFVKTNEDEAKAILAFHDFDAQFINDIWQKLDYTISLPQALIIAMEDGARWRIKQGIAEAANVPNYLDYIYFDALEEVKPKAIGIIR